MIRPFRTAAALTLALSFITPSLRAITDSEAEAGRTLVKQLADTVVGVELVVTIKLTVGDRPSPPRENKVDINGTVIAANGLTVTSLAAIDPRAQFEAMRAMGGTNRLELGETDFKEVKLRLADGSEIPARIVLKDADLDLAFIIPDPFNDASKRTFTFVDLSHATEGVALGSFFNLSRAPKALQRVPIIRPSLVLGIVEKPRRLYLVSDALLGCPTFDAQGRILGVSLQNLAGGRSTGLVTVPAADIAEIALQAAAVKIAPPVEPTPPPAPTATPLLPASPAPAAP